MDDTEKHDTIAKVTDRLAERYPDAPRPLVARVVAEEYETLDSSRIRTYIPTLVEHGAKNRLNREFTAQTPKI
jgi:chromosome segregation and condensation protein ScpB